MIQTTSFNILLYNSKPHLYKDKKMSFRLHEEMFAKAWKCPWALKPYCWPPHWQGSHVQAAPSQRRPPSQMLKAGRVQATRWVPAAEEMKLTLLKLLHKNPVSCFVLFSYFGPDLNVLKSRGAGIRGHRAGIKSGCTSPRCAAWRLKRWRADSSRALVPDRCH